MKNLKSSIAPNALQAVLDSARNAGAKGQAQWHTPFEWGRALALPLPDLRPNVTDLTCGNGSLLDAVKHDSYRLGCEIQPMPEDAVERITGDITEAYPLLKTVGFQTDLFALNFPWDLHFYRDKLALLAESRLPAVQSAFAAHDGRTSRDTIDSTVAGLCLALDLGTHSAAQGFIDRAKFGCR